MTYYIPIAIQVLLLIGIFVYIKVNKEPTYKAPWPPPPPPYRNQCILKVSAHCPRPGTSTGPQPSGEWFLEHYLNPYFTMIKAQEGKLIVDLDDVPGYSAGWLKSAFGGLATLHSTAVCKKYITIVCGDEPGLVREVFHYIEGRP